MRRFAENEIAPHAAEIDRTGEYGWANWEALKSMELTALSYPEEYGGSGASLVDQAIAAEELARVCASTSLAFLVNKLAMLPVINFGSEWMKSTYLPKICAGTSQGAYGLSEPDAGSDVASMTTRAVQDGDDWVISGTKCWITNAGVADLYTVFARTSDDRHTGITAFLVEADWGVEVEKLEHKLGMRRSPTGVIRLDDVRVPDRNRIGEVGQGFVVAMHTLDRQPPDDRRAGGRHRPGRARLRLRLHEGAHHVRQADRRAAGPAVDGGRRGDEGRGGPRAGVPGVRDGRRRRPARRARHAGAMAKAFASDVAMSVTTDAVQLLGGYGYTNEFPVERMMRDAKITQIYEGTNQIQRIVIARALLR